MKKLISVLLAILMLFSTATVAFAAEAETTAPETETTVPAEGEEEGTPSADELMGMLENMDWREVKAMLKIAKIAIKLVLVLDKLGFVDLTPIKNAILDMVWDMMKDYIEEGEAETTTAEAETTVEAAA